MTNSREESSSIQHLRETAQLSYQTILRKRSLQALALGPMICFVTTILFTTIHTARGPCSASEDIREEYENVDDLISFHMCCIPEWPIGATGYSIAGIMGLYAVPYMYHHSVALGRCCCCAYKCNRCCCNNDFGAENIREDSRSGDGYSLNRKWSVNSTVAICTAFISAGIMGVGIFSTCWIELAHGIFASFFFLGAIVLMFVLLCSVVDREISGTRTTQGGDDDAVKYTKQTLSYCSKLLRGASLLCLILSYVFGAIWGSFVAETFVGLIGLFALYAVLCELVLIEILFADATAPIGGGGNEGVVVVGVADSESEYILSEHDR
mmetsp:Transcript_21013/g.32058  ORF Transcript_21013/g.32058 Transcript_21013/m.32058 type:complete len:324 (+) Transcript_21013:152-1123(+)|eukprot:CAMPEP_0196819804 /NCGR_PEP_ID=MMETSP1362-20130617/72201_1 /TAXON_ID=163516 /ORGANISM="Leptocylindrus danicus, Strain CCMP1856" /LENGTH=323 /DNA_ID=CAMNT_0042198409 /DNA_START=48 /DNA_END=1019 /DNA_ORIENTATION=+